MSQVKLKEVIKLIKTMREQGVHEFRGMDLHIVLGGETILAPLTPPVRQTKATVEKANAIEQTALIKDNIQTVEDQLDLLLVENPAEYERLIREQELEDEKTLDRGAESAIQ